MLLFFIYKIIIFLSEYLPVQASYFICRRAIDILYLFNKKDQKIVKENLKKIKVPDDTLRKDTKQIFYNFSYYLVDFLSSFNFNKNNIDQYAKSFGENNIKQALEKNKGAIMLTAHIGNWEMGGIYLGLKGYKMNAVALKHKNERINNIFDERRKKHDETIFPLKNASKASLKALKNNELVAVLCDRIFDKKEKPIVSELCGNKINIPRGPAYLSIISGAALIPSFSIRSGLKKFEIFFEQPIYPPEYNRETIEKDVIILSNLYMKKLEEYIIKYPLQWYAFQNVWE